MKSFVFKINLENHHTVCTLIDNMSLEKRYHHHTLTVLDNKYLIKDIYKGVRVFS